MVGLPAAFGCFQCQEEASTCRDTCSEALSSDSTLSYRMTLFYWCSRVNDVIDVTNSDLVIARTCWTKCAYYIDEAPGMRRRLLEEFPTLERLTERDPGSRLRPSRDCPRLLDLTRRRFVVAWHPDSPT
jgi:hypothetical protein